jgi:tetratricopeptide (TPR) repeat protein
MNESDSDVYKNPGTYLALAITWYHLENYLEAKNYFKKIVENKQFENSLFYPSALLWSAVLSQRSKDSQRADELILTLMRKFPHSIETEMVNKL